MRAFLLVPFAVLGGVGVVYAPAATFTVVAVAFVVGVWILIRSKHPGSKRSGSFRSARKRRAIPGSLTSRMVSGFLLVWWLALVAPLATFSPRDISSAAQSTVGGSLSNQVLLIAFGFVGLLFVPRALKGLNPAFRWAAGLWVLYLCWIFTSLYWSVYPPLTFRNAVAFALVSVGSFGLGAGFYGSLPKGRDLLLRHVFIAGVLSASTILLPLPFRWGEYDLLDPAQRLDIGGGFPSYVIRPAICALLVLVGTAIVGVRRWQRQDWVWTAVLVIPLLVLKSRGPILYALLAVAILYLLFKTSTRDRVFQGVLLFTAGVGAYVYYFTGVYDRLIPYLTRGDVDSTLELTGRIPLWEILIPEIQEHRFAGIGFAAFWNPENLPVLEQSVGFPVVSAHNGFIDILLGTGIVGLVLLLAFCLSAMALALGQARRGDTIGWLVFVLLSFYLLHNLTVSIFPEFLEITLIAILAMLSLMAKRKAVSRQRDPIKPRTRRHVATPR